MDVPRGHIALQHGPMQQGAPATHPPSECSQVGLLKLMRRMPRGQYGWAQGPQGFAAQTEVSAEIRRTRSLARMDPNWAVGVGIWKAGGVM